MLPILTVRDLSTGYGKRQVLFNVNLDVMRGEIFLIAGGNGSGKSTLLKTIFGLLPAWNEGAKIVFRPNPNGPEFSTQPPTLNLCKGLGYLPQKNAVFDNLTVEDNIRLAGYTLRDNKEFAARREDVLSTLPLLLSLLHRKPEKMSGGERQIVALAMLLLHRPKLLLLDEPIAGLSASNAELIASNLQTMNQRIGVTLIVIEHRGTEWTFAGKRKCRMRLGTLENDPCESKNDFS